MWGNTPLFDFSRKTLVSMSPVRLRPCLMGTLAAQPHQSLSGADMGCYVGFNHGCSRQALEPRALGGRAEPTWSTAHPTLAFVSRTSFLEEVMLYFSERNEDCLQTCIPVATSSRDWQAKWNPGTEEDVPEAKS